MSSFFCVTSWSRAITTFEILLCDRACHVCWSTTAVEYSTSNLLVEYTKQQNNPNQLTPSTFRISGKRYRIVWLMMPRQYKRVSQGYSMDISVDKRISRSEGTCQSRKPSWTLISVSGFQWSCTWSQHKKLKIHITGISINPIFQIVSLPSRVLRTWRNLEDTAGPWIDIDTTS